MRKYNSKGKRPLVRYSLGRTLDGLCGKRVRGFGDDDPGDQIGDGADSCEESEERGEDSDESKVPSIMQSQTGADSGDDPILAWPS
jgi:hypothetical protein